MLTSSLSFENCNLRRLVLEQDDHYGEDTDAPTAESDEEAVTIPEIRCPTSETQLANLQQSVNPMDFSESYGMDLYEQAVQCIMP
jgi:hypothetical protein